MNKWTSNWFRFQLRKPVEEGSDLGGATDELDLAFLGLDEGGPESEHTPLAESETDQAATVQGEGQEADPAAVPAAKQGEVVADPVVETTQQAVVDPAAAVAPETPPVVVDPVVTEDPAQENQKHQEDLVAYKTALESQYALSEEDAELFFENPNAVLPKLAANLHMQVLEHVLKVVSQALPNEIANYQTRSSKQVELETQFTTRWPDLDIKNPETAKAVANAVTLAKQALPGADLPVLIERVGLITHSLLGSMPLAVGQQPAPAAAPVPPAKPKPAQVATTAGQTRQVNSAQDPWGSWIDQLESDK